MENEKKNFVKKFDSPGIQYGNYAWCDESQIEKAKEELLEQMIAVIRELAKKDDFWIVKKPYVSNPIGMIDCPVAGMDNPCTVGWKIAIDHMAQK